MPYDYPKPGTDRKHGPSGYSDYADFRPWLRDEFTFRCAYCLFREEWAKPANISGYFHIDHIRPQTERPDLINAYENLTYCCFTCNSNKGGKVLPELLECLNEDRVDVDDQGKLVVRDPADKNTSRLIDALALNRRSLVNDRVTRIKQSANGDEESKKPFHFPEDLPDLSRLRPKENTKPQGINACYYKQRKDELLEKTYC